MAQNSGKACCRLCLAPENECVDIFKTQAADKLPIQTKISSCVQIQVSENQNQKQNEIFVMESRRSVQLCSSDSPQRREAHCVREKSISVSVVGHMRVKAAEMK